MVDYIICENPLHSLKLLNKLGIKKKLFSLHDHNEVAVIKKIHQYQLNSTIALISDAGSPLISDPGYKLVLDYIEKNIDVIPIPGPTSIIPALQISGLPVNNFKFYGFVSKNNAAVLSLVKEVEGSDSTSVIFVSGNRIISFLEAVQSNEIKRGMAVCKEITKKNEKVFRGGAEEIIDLLLSKEANLRGEFVVVISGKQKKSVKSLDEIVHQQIKVLLKKFSLTEVVQIVHKLTHISKKEIYSAALLLKDE